MKIKRVGLLMVVLTLLLSASGQVRADAPVCYSDKIDSVDVITLNVLARVTQSRTNLRGVVLRKTILALTGRPTWVGYANGGFSPRTAWYEMVMVVHFSAALGKHANWVSFGSANGRPDYRQVYWFPSMEQFADGNGRHMGEHPNCGWNAIEVPADTVTALRQLAGVR